MISGWTTPFHGEGHHQRGTISVAPINQEQALSLQFQVVSNHLLRRLAEKGYTPVSTNSNSQFTAYVTYGIDTGRTVTSAVPLYGQTGGGTSMTTGNIIGSTGRMSSFNTTTTTMPTYGIVGMVPVSSREYRRELNVDIYRNAAGRPVTKVYEVRAFSSGSCGNINAIILNIIDGAFKNFPGESGRSRRSEVEWSGSC
ncbi:MAG: DUF4136 domain-containing protein [Alphaproteobacteria bacterium]|nr:DUF4136 domain-containing protein [Alphaproteobacteria bacterium]